MPTVIETDGYAARIFTKDHGEPHVHVYHNGSLMKVWLSPVGFDSYKGRKPRQSEVIEAQRIVTEHRAACLVKWKQIYG